MFWRAARQNANLPACFMSPLRMMCGQCCSVFAKKGLVTPRMTDGLWMETGRENTGDSTIIRMINLTHSILFVFLQIYLYSALLKGSTPAAVLVHLYSRSLGPGGVLLKFTVVDGEVRSEVTAVTQGRDAAAERHTTQIKGNVWSLIELQRKARQHFTDAC